MAMAAFALAAGLPKASAASAPAARRVEVKAMEFSETKYLSEASLRRMKQTGRLLGHGEATYEFGVPATGWYELWVEATRWSTDLYLDGKFLIHTPFASDLWEPDGKAHKVMNLHLERGRHRLRFYRPWHPGLPWMSRFYLQPARDVTGMVRLEPQTGYLAFRKGQAFPVLLNAGKQRAKQKLVISIVDPAAKRTVGRIIRSIPPGAGLHQDTLSIPTDREGIFEVRVTDPRIRPVARLIQYIVIDTQTRPSAPARLAKKLIATIDCTERKPDYRSDETRVTHTPLGAYRESGDRGYYQYSQDCSFFAYTLPALAVQKPHLVEVDCPDDDERIFTMSIVEQSVCPYPMDSGIVCGGRYAMSNRLHVHQIFFHPRRNDPRLVFLNWHTGQRAAASKIRIYRVTSGLPDLAGASSAIREAQPPFPRRTFGMYWEECLRFTTYFGAMPEGNEWPNLHRALDRWGQWSRYMGMNMWVQTIAVYQALLWPSKAIVGYGPDLAGFLGPQTAKEPFQKDIMRLQLLTCEKYGIDYVGELHIPPNRVLKHYLDERFGGKGRIDDNGPHKPWLIVSKDGRIGGSARGMPYFNPVHPAVQDWVASIVEELAQRYKDSPAFKGVALRLMGWAFSSWQTFPSIHWGYGDYTCSLFQRETGVEIPVPGNARDRYARRYQWLMANAYEPWAAWRCKSIRAYYERLAKIVTDARPTARLYINAFGPHYGNADWSGDKLSRIAALDDKGWTKLARESGIDAILLNRTPGVVFSDSRTYPPGIRSYNGDAAYRAAALAAEFVHTEGLEATSKPAPGGTVAATRFCNQYMEADMLVKKIGFANMPYHSGVRSKQIGIAAALNAAGRHALARYAAAMADGNVTLLVDGGLGYVLGQPLVHREFAAEYCSLPAVGMERLPGSGDPVALWQGRHEGRGYLYVVNRASYPLTARVQFTDTRPPRRLVTGDALEVAGDGTVALALEPYQLVALTSDRAATELSVDVADTVREQVASWLSFVEELLAGHGGAADKAIIPFSLVAQRRAEAKLAEARRAHDAGRYWSARLSLMHHHLVEVYEAFAAYPPGLFQRKAPR